MKKWYLHLYDVTQADLNWDNPQVREELKDILRFWKEKGIRAFRFDVINLVSKPAQMEDDYKGDGRRFYTDGPHIHEYLKELVHDAGIEEFVTVGEMSSTTLENCIRYSNPTEKELAMCFNFHHLKVDYKNGDKWALMEPDYKALKTLFKEWQESMQEGGGWNALFWCNHDQPRIVSRMGNEGSYWKQSAKMLAGMIHLMRGTPYIYQGEEIGMLNAHYPSIELYRDVESLNYYQILLEKGKTADEALAVLAARSRDNSRTPMQWNGDVYGGFSREMPWLSMSARFCPEITVEAEQQDADSILMFYKKLIDLRKKHPIISKGRIHFLDLESDRIMAYERSLGDQRMVVFCNMSEQRQPLDIPDTWKDGRIFLENYENREAVVKEALKNAGKSGKEIEKEEYIMEPYELLVLEKRKGENER